MPLVQQQETVPDELLSNCTLDRHDYVDVFAVRSTDMAVAWPEYWARAAIDSAAGIGGQFVWRAVLGLRLEGRPENVAGWRVVANGDDWIALEAASRLLTAQIVVRVEEGQVTVATFIRYDRRLGSVVWPPLASVHRRLMPGLLRRTERIVAGARS